MFQPAEETSAGALAMIDEGLLDIAGRPVDAAYCLHVMSSGRPLGVWFSRPGPLMAASDEFVVRVIGAGGHGSAPHLTLDPIPVACEMVTALQTLVTRRVDIDDPVVLTVGKFAAGTKENIIPDEATFEATIRSFSPQNRVFMKQAVLRLLEGLAAAHGLRAEIEWTPGYPPTVNDLDEYAFARATLVDLFGDATDTSRSSSPTPARRTSPTCSSESRVPTCRSAPAHAERSRRRRRTTTRRGRCSTTRCCPTVPRSWPRWRSAGWPAG